MRKYLIENSKRLYRQIVPDKKFEEYFSLNVCTILRRDLSETTNKFLILRITRWKSKIASGTRNVFTYIFIQSGDIVFPKLFSYRKLKI